MTKSKPSLLCRRGLLLGLLLAAAGCSKDPEVAKREYVQSGDAYMKEGKVAEALIEYRNAVQQDPRYGEARSKLAEAYVRTGDIPNAYREFVRAADLLPADVTAQLKAGEVLLLARQFEDAQARADKALAIAPQNIDAMILRANAFAGLNRLEDAIAEVEEAIQTAPDRSASYASLGAMKLLHGDAAEAEAAYRQAVAADTKSVPARLALANFFWSTNRRQEAETHLKEALSLDPTNSLAGRALASFYMASQRAAEAEPYLRTIAESSEDASGKLQLADYYITQQRAPEARRVLEDLVKSNPDEFAAATIRLANISLLSGKDEEATALVDSILEKNGSNVRALLTRTQLRLRARDFDGALQAATAAVAAQPQSAETQYALGRVRAIRREDTEAIAAFSKAIEINPRFALAEVDLARLQLAAGRLDAAEQLARSAVTKASGYADAHLLLTQIQLLRGDVGRAEPTLRALAKQLPEASSVQLQIGQLESRKGNVAAARLAFGRIPATSPDYVAAVRGLVGLDLREKRADAARARVTAAVGSSPRDAQVLLLAGQTFQALGDARAAEDAFRQTIEVDPGFFEGYSALGRFYVSQKKLPEAQASFEQLAQKRPSSVAAHTVVGLLLHMQNRYDEARAKYRAALNVDPRAAVAANNLAYLQVEQGGNLDDALALAQTAKAGLPDRHEVNDTLGWIYVKKGLPSLGIPPLEQAVKQSPDTAVYHYHLGLAYVGTKDPTRARASFEQALKLDPKFAGADEARKFLESM